METKIIKSINLIRRGSGANLNLFRYTAMVLVLLTLGIGNAWGSTTYYSKVTTSQSPTGKGTVYVVAGSSFSGTAPSATNNGTSQSQTYSLQATPTVAGYYFVNWTSTGTTTVNFNSATSSATTATISASSTTSGSPTTGNAQANWAEITIGAGVASPASINATDNSTTCTDYTGTMTFATKADAKNDFKDATPPIVNTGHGAFEVTGWDVNASTGAVTVNYKFHGDGTYGGNVAKTSRSRSTSATLTLTSAVGTNKNTCSVSASFPNIIVSEGSADAMTTINTTPKTAEATFPVQWADDEEDFTVAFSEISGGGAWTVNSISYASGTITVNYTFDPQAEVGNHSAKLTLSANANAGGASNYVVINAVSEALASDDASVTYNNTTTNYGKLADAISAANSKPGAVVKLLRNIPVDDAHKLTERLVITGVMTLDLNSYAIDATGMSSTYNQIIRLDAATAVLTLKDSRTGGVIRGTGNNSTGLNAIVVNKGALNIESGTIDLTNTNTGADAKAHAVRVIDGSRVLMSGGTINATTAGQQARGIYSTTTPANAQMVVVTGGTINTTAAALSIGIECESNGVSDLVDPSPEKANVILSGVTINAETTGTTDAYAVRTAAGVVLGINDGTYNATAKTTTATALKSNGYTAVLGGAFNAEATTTTARALHVAAGIAAVKGGTFTAIASTDLANGADIESGAKLLTYGGTFTGRLTKIAASKYAIGANVKVGGTLEAQGGTFVGEAANSTLTAKQTSFACGVFGVEGKSTINMSNATMRGELQSNYLSNGDVSTWNGGAYGFYSRSSNPCGLTNCTISATSAYQGGFGIRFAYTQAEVKNCTVTVNTTYEYNYGLFVGGEVTDIKLYNTNFTCTSGTTYGYGIYAYNGKTYAENCTINVTTQHSTATEAADCNLFGVKVNTGKRADLKGCTITATGNGTYSKNGYGVYVDGSADIEDCNVTVSGINTGAYALANTANTTWLGVVSGKFKATATSTAVSANGTAAAAKQQLYGGYYNTNTNLSKYLPTGYGIETLPSGSTEYSEGYRYAIRATEDVGDPVCKIGATPYTTLEEALEYASKNATSSNKLTILMTANYTLPAGDYTLPQYTTLLIPRSGQTSLEEHPTRVYNAYTTPACNLKLTFASGVHMDVLGTIQTQSKQSAKGQGGQNNGMPHESYGWLYLNSGSTITLENGAKLYAWGYVTGPGEIDAKRGSVVYEFFQIKDWRGGTCTGNMNGNSQEVFPLNQYYIQNIESPIKFRPGSSELCDGTVNAGSAARSFNGVKLIGVTNSGSLFEMANEDMSEDTWVRKWYDAVNDKQVYEINSSASINSIKLTLNTGWFDVEFVSSSYIMPLTNNMKIHLLTGSMNITQNVELLPGAEIEIDKEATAYINSGKSLYVFSLSDWDKFPQTSSPVTYTYPVPYSPSWAGSGKTCPRSVTTMADAAINLHGKFVVNGYLYTTAGGGNIHSTNEDAGTITYNVAAPSTSTTVYVANGQPSTQTYNGKTANPAWLQNEDGTHEETAGTAVGKTWMYYDGKWNCWTETNCFGYDAQNHPYAKPAAYVQLTSDVADANHLYHDAATGNRAFILEDGCTWWEVEPTPYDGNKYKCVDADYSGKYKYYEYVNNKWQEALVTVTWKNGDATLATYSKALYGTRPSYLDANPTKASSSSEYYTWLGWAKGSADGEFFAKEAELPIVTENTTFYAYFETHKFEYTITFRSESGAVLEAKRWAHGEIPTYDGTPTKTPTAAKEYTFDGWSSTKGGSKVTVAAASAATDYYAHFAESDRKYTIQWVNYNGTVLKEEQVAYNTTPSAPTTPTRPNDDYYTYTFDTWSPAVGTVTGNQTYTATYTYEKRVNKYEVLFKNGPTTIYSQNLVEKTVPVFDGNEPTKEATAQYSYTFDGWSTTDGGALAYAKNAVLPALTADVTYYAHFAATTNTYKVLWKSADGKQLLETDAAVAYGATPEYNGTTPTKANLGTTIYAFDGWSASVGGAILSTLPAVTEDKVFYARFSVAVASVTAGGTDYYGTIADAIKAANEKSNATVTMLKDVTTTSEVTISAAMTIDLNGKTVSSTLASATGVFKVNASGKTVTIKDSGTGGKIDHTANFNGKLYGINLTAGTLKIESGTVYAKNTANDSNYRAYGINTESSATEVIVSGGTIEANSPQMAFGLYTNNACALTMTGGTFTASSTSSSRGVYVKGATTLTDATITATGSGAYAIFAVSGDMTINSGTYTASGASDNLCIFHRNNAITINGGHFSTTNKLYQKDTAGSYTGTITLKGGYYSNNTELAAKCATNYRVKALADTHPEYADGYRCTVNNLYSVTWTGESVTERTDEVPYGETPSYGEEPTKDPDVSQVYTFKWMNTSNAEIGVKAVTADVTYAGSFTGSPRPYTITFKNDNDQVLRSDDFDYGTEPSYGGSTPVSSHTGDGYEYTFIRWTPALTAVSGPATYTAVYSRSAESITVNTEETVTDNTSATTTTVVDGGTLTVGTGNEDITLLSTTIIVESGGQLDVEAKGSIEADVFIIQATTEEQGEEDAKEEVQVSGELSETGSKNLQAIYYDLTRKHGTENFLARVWYAVAVPWAVEVPTYNNGGVYIKQGEEFVQQRLGATFDLITYDGNCRATQGASADCWVYLEDEIAGGADPAMVPGKLYMIYLTQETSTIRFKKKADGAIHTSELAVSTHEADIANDANWNGIANPATYKAYMNIAVDGLVQKFVPGTQPRDGGRYLPIDLDDKQSVGQPFFVQVASTSESTVQVTRTNTSASSAPRRVQAQNGPEARYAIGLAANGKLADRLYIQTSEEKEDRYEVGKDMSKMGVSAHVAQMWVDRYDSKLCLNSAILTNNKANYPLGIYAPQAGEYKIFAPADIESGDNIYLTLDDRVIWNLSMGAYYASLEKGTTTRYGLRLVRSNAPSVATGVDEVHSGNTQCTKVIMDDHVYILRNGEMYSIDGQLVK